MSAARIGGGSGASELKREEKIFMRTLADIVVGGEGVVSGYTEDGEMAGRLSCLGLIPGVEVFVLKRAPLGDPVLVVFEGQELSLRKVEAQCVEVEG